MEYCRVLTEIDDFENSIKIAPPSLAEVLKFRREQQQMSQSQMAQSLSMPKSRYKALESGKQEPSFGEARKLKGIGISYDILFQPIVNNQRCHGEAVDIRES